MINAVVIDEREPAWIKKLTFGGALTTTARMDCGDLQVVTDDAIIIIERKTPEDFLASMKDNRLFVQVSKLRKVSKWAYVLITGEFKRGENGNVITETRATEWNWNAAQGAILSIQEAGVFVHQCNGDNDFENAVTRIANRSRSEISWIEPVRDLKIVSGDIAMICALPNVGIEKAQRWLEDFGTPAWVLHALTSDDYDVPQAGQVTKDMARRILFGNRNKDMVLVPLTRDAYEELKKGQHE